MFKANNHYQLHTARQTELEAEAQDYRISSALTEGNSDALRKQIGATLISFGEKLAQESKKEAQLTFSAQR